MFRAVRHCTTKRSAIDLDFLTVQLGVVEQADCHYGVFGVGHFDEPESATDACLIAYREGPTYLSGAPKKSHQIDTRHRSSEIANVNFGHARLSSQSSKNCEHLTVGGEWFR
jgi:hypothetical protein